jgi:hypothetical protein
MGIPGIFFVFIFGPRLLTLELSARLTFNAFIEIVLFEGRPALSCFLNNSISCVRTPVAGKSRQNLLTIAGRGLTGIPISI